MPSLITESQAVNPVIQNGLIISPQSECKIFAVVLEYAIIQAFLGSSVGRAGGC